MNMTHKIKESFYALYRLYIKKEIPVIVYAPGRVGSMGLIKNLRKADVFSFKVESLTNEKQGAARFSKKLITDKKKTAMIITIVRDPLDMMCTYYYSKMIRGWIPEAKVAYAEKNIPKLQEIFIKKCLRTNRLDSHLYWYENDWEKSLGFSIFDQPFNRERKYSIFKHNNYKVLTYRTDLEDEKKQIVLKEYLNKDINVTRENVRTEKTGSEGFKEFKETIKIPEDLIEKIYSSNYVKHFFTTEEISNLKAKWSKIS